MLKRGAVLVDEGDLGEAPRLLFTLEHAVQDGRKGRHGSYNVVSQRLEFIEAGVDLKFRRAGAAPYLDYRGATEAERADAACRDGASQPRRASAEDLRARAPIHEVDV